MDGWRALVDECARWRDAGRLADVWWRDDDAGAPDPALDRLLGLSKKFSVPLALAVIPARTSAALFARLGDTVSVLQHGTDHRNRAGAAEKKTEFPESEPADAALARLSNSRAQLAGLASGRCLPVLAPPWNRLPEHLATRLPEAGYRGLSRYGAKASTVPGLRQVNTHVDIVAWRSGGGFIGEAEALDALRRHLAARREAGSGDATGLLTHHAVHDEAAWRFIERLLETTRRLPGLRWRTAQELFHT